MHRSPSALGCVVFAATLAGCSDVSTLEVASSASGALTTPGLFFQGDNFSGAERGFGSELQESWGAAIPGVEGQTYSWPRPGDKQLPTGMNIVRLPFQWERLQPSLNGDFDAGYLGKLRATAGAWRDLGANVLLDVHNYAYYKVNGRGTSSPGQHIGSAEVPVAAFADLWRRMALEFGSASNSSPFIFGLMNEPHDIDVAVWVSAAQQAVTAIRATGAKNPVFVPGADWTTATDFSWSANASQLQAVTDPGDNFAIEVHQYYDGACTSSCYVDKLKPFEDWAVAHGRVAFLGEMDLTDSTAACREAFSNLIDHLHAKAAGTGGVWVGYTYWEGTNVSAGLPYIQPHLPATCADGARDGTETDVDCGSICLRCANGKACTHDYDCRSGFCASGACNDSSVPGSGGTAGSGGSSSGGSVARGGAATGGGSTNGGGALGTGGVTARGGAGTSGGSTNSGGALGTGGVTARGGSTSGGSTSSGGALGTGGDTARGGARTSGGSTSSGGALGTGGVTARGGSTSGGSTSSGGALGTGGDTARGGARTGTSGGSTSSGGAVATGGALADAGLVDSPNEGAEPGDSSGSTVDVAEREGGRTPMADDLREANSCGCRVASGTSSYRWVAALVVISLLRRRRWRPLHPRYRGSTALRDAPCQLKRSPKSPLGRRARLRGTPRGNRWVRFLP